MYPAISQMINHHKLVAASIRLFEVLSLSIKRPVCRKSDNNETLDYFMRHIEKGSTVVDIGLHSFDYIHLLRKLSKTMKKLVVFEAGPESQRYLARKKDSLQMNNVEIEDIHLSVSNENVFAGRQLCKTGGATVIDFAQKLYKTVTQVNSETLDKYCQKNEIRPDYIRINAEGQELSILEGATGLLTHHPTLLISCEERYAGRERILETFNMLSDLGYEGYFILGDARIPIANFDFNIYQNPVYDFYCKEFVFEY